MDDIFDYDFTMGGGDQTYFGGNTLGDTSWIDNFDWGSALANLDFSGLDLGGLDLSSISLDNLYQDLGDFGTLLNESSVPIIDPYEVDQQTSRNEYNWGQGIQDPYEVDQQTSRDEYNWGQGIQDPYEVDGAQGSREGIRNILTGTSGGIGGGKGLQDVIKTIKQLAPNKDNAMLYALLGGLLGLLNKGSAPKGPVGYQGGIPKYTATRVPGRGVEYTRAAQGGLMGLKQGQYLDGATDGMADKIQTNIEGKQPARLSHGEFVIPADVVSHLGNGNSDAGADVLYEMMAKVRKARTGTPKQGKQINPRKMIPA